MSVLVVLFQKEMCKFKSAREQLISVRIEVCLSNGKRRLGKSESHWPRLTILLAEYSARASALHCNGSPKPNAPGYVPRYDPRGHFVKNFIRHWPEKGPFGANLKVQHCSYTDVNQTPESAQPPGEGADSVRIDGKVEF